MPSLWTRGVAVAVALFAGDAMAAAADVTVQVQGVTPSPSRVYVSLCTAGLAPENCTDAQVVAADRPDIPVRFADVSPGVYAVAAFQDVNGNGVLDRSPRGLPREPYGFSREAGRTSAPRFDRASFVAEGAVAVTVRLAAPGRP